MDSPSLSNAPAISTDGLVKRFGDVEAVRGVTLSVPTGTVLGLLGPNGAGKTTVVRVLTTILHPDEGQASVLGLDVVRDAEAIRATIGLAGQYAAVDENLTGRENLKLVGKLTHLTKRSIGPRADELLERFRLADAGDRVVKTYSGGMRRRLDLAAALVHRPPILFLDEPTTGLDPRSRNDLWAVIQELVADGTTVLLTTQYLEEADRLADNIAVIDHGEVIAEGTSTELKADFGATIVELRFGEAASAAKASSLLGSDAMPTEVAADGRTVEAKLCPEANTSVFDVVRALDAAHLEPDDLIVREPTLDDVFLSLTGHAADQADDQENEALEQVEGAA
jgi:ABC-2 type transport system ATP-binding protein